MKRILLLILILPVTVQAADTELQDLDELTAIVGTDVLYVVDDPGGTPVSKKITAANIFDLINTYALLNAIMADFTLTHNGLFDTFSELNAIVANKTLVNEEDAVAWDALGTFGLGITITTGDPFIFGTTRWDNGSDLMDGERIANDTIDNDSIDWSDMADLTTDGAVSWGNIAEGELANSTVIGADIKDDTIDSADYAAGSIDYEHLADNIISGAAAITAFESGDTFLILEAGVGLREADFDDLPSSALTEEQVEDFVGGMLGGTETHIAVTYEDGTNDIDFVVDPDSVAGFISAGAYNDNSINDDDINWGDLTYLTTNGAAIDEVFSSGWDNDVGPAEKDDIYDIIHAYDTDDDGDIDTIDGSIAALLYEIELDDFSELQAQISDKTLVNTADGASWSGTHIFSGATVTMPKRTKNDDRFYLFNAWNPNALYDTDTQICFEPNLPANITITEVTITLDADPTTELDWDLKWADAFIGLGGATLIVAIDTTNGTTDVDSGWNDATVVAGKCLYIEMAADPDSNIKQAIVKIRYDFD